MSKPTLQERAAAFMEQETGSTAMHGSADIDRLVLFAAQEVARVRREAIAACDNVLGPLTNGGARNAIKEVRACIVHASLPRLDDVLRGRGLKHVGFIEKGGVVTDVNHKPDHLTRPWAAAPGESYCGADPPVGYEAAWGKCVKPTGHPRGLDRYMHADINGKTWSRRPTGYLGTAPDGGDGDTLE